MAGDLFPDALIRRVRLVPIVGMPPRASGMPPAASGMPQPGLVDLRIRGGVVTEVAPGLAPKPGEQVHEGDSRWAIPGLWDQHVHLAQWAATRARLDLTGTSGPAQVLERLRAHLTTLDQYQHQHQHQRRVVVGFGHRSATWSHRPSVTDLDAVTGDRPVVLVSGDGHHGWLNSAALQHFGLPPTDDVVAENDWFPVFARLDTEAALTPQEAEAAYREVVAEAHAKGVVGVVDMEFGSAYRDWPARFAAGLTTVRVRAATYPQGLDEAIADGLHTGADLARLGGRAGSDGLVQMGPLKVISDGSLNTRSAYCHEPYADSPHPGHPRGWPNLTAQELTELLRRATAHGFEVAVHAIGDAAVGQALDCFAATGARGGIEHAQLVTQPDVARMAALGVSASVQPAHLLDDRDVTTACWPGREDRCFALRRMLDAGVVLRLGSDAPVSPLDPWLAMAAAVHRSADARAPWVPEQALTVAEALAASTDGQPTLGVGSRGDVVLLDADPLAATRTAGADAPGAQGAPAADGHDTGAVAAWLRGMPVAATFVGGRRVFGA